MLKATYRALVKVLPYRISESIRLCMRVILNPLPGSAPPRISQSPITYSARETFAAAKEEAGLGYSTPDLLIGVSRPNTEALLQNLPAFFAPLFASLAIASISNNNKPLRVLDFGGALGDQFDFAKAAFGKNFLLDWTVVETSLYVDYANREGLNHVKFFKSIDDANSTFDFALFSGVLQYVEHWREALTHSTVLASEFILISRIPVGEAEIPFLQTVRSPDKTVRYPGRVMRLADINEALEATHKQLIGWNLDHHMGELGICPAPAMLWRKRAQILR